VIEVEVFGADALRREGPPAHAPPGEEVPTFAELQRLCILAASCAGVRDGHLAVEFVDSARIAQLNEAYRKQPTPTDVLAFPVDGASSLVPVELGDVVICAEHTVDLREAVVHGVLHLVGMDHETDNGEMLALQRELLAADSG
jgi:probable rRNA maturation factor